MPSPVPPLLRSARRGAAAWLLALLSLAAAAEPGKAQVDETLARIAETGTINLGHRESSVPFSYYDQKHQVVGYAHELMLRVVDAVKTELKLPALTVRLVPLTSQNRIPLVQNGTVDLECGSTTHNAERAQQAAFSTSFFIIGTRLMVHRDSGIRGFDDLAGRRVVVTAATTSERLLRTLDERLGGRIEILSAKDHGGAFEQLESGRAQAFMMDDALLYGERAKARRPDDWEVVGRPMSSEPYACMMRRGNPGLKRIVDRELTRLMTSGEALKIYAKWFQRPIPPRGLNLNWPPSEALLELYRQPNDRPRS
ncbi:MAG: transporter substrate-binding domain-containing protein [Burkholderiaceae bacterium]|nr:transporter substrate-binding domain-containing protein [Burkholderiaceae bacterium]